MSRKFSKSYITTDPRFCPETLRVIPLVTWKISQDVTGLMKTLKTVDDLSSIDVGNLEG